MKKKVKLVKLTKSQFGARLRRLSEEIASSYDFTLPTGELVSEKYVTNSIGLKLTNFEPEIKKYIKPDYIGVPIYRDAEKHYRYRCKVLWLYHPDLGTDRIHQYSDMPFDSLKKANEKKVLERLKQL